MSKDLIEKLWDYSIHAKFYIYRPNYSDKAIDMLVHYVGASGDSNSYVADIGAGNGNLSVMLVDRGLKVIAIEPNDEMSAIGKDRIRSPNIRWIKANGIITTLKDKSVDWVTFGSSFNVMDRHLALQEAHRVLKGSGFFTCMWNHRQLNDPMQKIAEDTIVEFVPNYNRGTRRDDQRPIIEEHKDLFKNIFHLELDFDIKRTIGEYINAWRSVKNKYWDLSTEEGLNLFQKIADKMKERLPDKFSIRYTTRAWTAQKAD